VLKNKDDRLGNQYKDHTNHNGEDKYSLYNLLAAQQSTTTTFNVNVLYKNYIQGVTKTA